MDLGSLIIIIGVGATADTVADVHQGKSPVVPVLGAGLLLVILGAVGKVTGQWGLVAALAVLYLLASLLNNWRNIPALSSPTNGNTVVNALINAQNKGSA